MARRALGSATLALVQAVTTTLESERQPIMVACSGGPDSLALAAAARHVADRDDVSASAVIIDHGLQEGSGQVAAAAAAQLTELGFDDVAVVEVTVDPTGPGPEGAARDARYQALDEEAVRRDALVLLGHTLDDQAETVLLGLVRGSGTRSLAGMPAAWGRFRRPLLGLRRADTERACTELGLTAWTDPHNTDPRFTRSRLRHTVLPLLEAELGPGITEALARTALLARDDADLLDTLAAAVGTPEEALDCAVLLEQPPALRRRMIKFWLVARGVPDAAYVHVRAVEQLVVRWRGQRGIAVPGAVVVRDAGRLHCS